MLRLGCVVAVEGRKREAARAAGGGHPQRDDLDRRVGQRVPVEPTMALVEAREQRVHREITLGPWDRELEALVAVAEVGQTGEPPSGRRDALGGEPPPRQALELLVLAGQGV